MTYDFETLNDGSATQKPSSPSTSHSDNPAASMAQVRAALAQSLMPEGDGSDILQKQMMQMDIIFNQTLQDYANCPLAATSLTQSKRMALVLKLQQNCAQTARTLRSMRYMAALEGCVKRGESPATPPTHRCESEQTGLGENDS